MGFMKHVGIWVSSALIGSGAANMLDDSQREEEVKIRGQHVEVPGESDRLKAVVEGYSEEDVAAYRAEKEENTGEELEEQGAAPKKPSELGAAPEGHEEPGFGLDANPWIIGFGTAFLSAATVYGISNMAGGIRSAFSRLAGKKGMAPDAPKQQFADDAAKPGSKVDESPSLANKADDAAPKALGGGGAEGASRTDVPAAVVIGGLGTGSLSEAPPHEGFDDQKGADDVNMSALESAKKGDEPELEGEEPEAVMQRRPPQGLGGPGPA